MLRRTKSEMLEMKAQSLISGLPRSEWSAAYHGTYSKQDPRVRISFLDFGKTHGPIPVDSRGQQGIPLKQATMATDTKGARQFSSLRIRLLRCHTILRRLPGVETCRNDIQQNHKQQIPSMQ